MDSFIRYKLLSTASDGNGLKIGFWDYMGHLCNYLFSIASITNNINNFGIRILKTSYLVNKQTSSILYFIIFY